MSFRRNFIGDLSFWIWGDRFRKTANPHTNAETVFESLKTRLKDGRAVLKGLGWVLRYKVPTSEFIQTE